MRRSLLLTALLAVCLQLAAQQDKLDSVQKRIDAATSDTNRVKEMFSKILIWNAVNYDSSIELTKKAIELSVNSKFTKGEFHLRENLATIYSYKGDATAAREQLTIIERDILPGRDSADYAQTYGAIGMFYGMQAKYDSSIYYYDKAVGMNERGHNKHRLANNYSNIAIGYQQQSNFTRALEYQQKALKLAEDEGNEDSQAYTWMNIGNTYYITGDTTMAETAFANSQALAKKLKLKNVEMYANTNLADLYIRRMQWQNAYDHATRAATLAREMNDDGILAASLARSASAMANLGRVDEAETVAREAVSLATRNGNPLNMSISNLALASVLRILKKWKESIVYFKAAIASMKDADSYNMGNATAFQLFADSYEQLGDYKNALAQYKNYSAYRDSSSSKNNIRNTTQLTMQYEFAKKEAATQALQAQKDAEAASVKSKQYFMIAALGIIALAVLIIAFIQLRNNRQKQKANLLLQEQKEQLEVALADLRSTQAQLIQSEKMASLGQLTAGIAHEIQNPLNFVNNFSDVSGELISELRSERTKAKHEIDEVLVDELLNDISQNVEKINHHGKRADAIVKGMLQHSKTSSGKKELTNINALTEEYLRLALHGMKAKDVTFNVRTETDFDANLPKAAIIPQDIGRVLLNLYNNAFYAVNARLKANGQHYDPLVTVSTRKVNNNIEIRVTDNGTGIPPNIIDKVFQPFFTTKPTGQGTGLGLSLSYDIISQGHGGKLTSESKEGEGATFIVSLPAA